MFKVGDRVKMGPGGWFKGYKDFEGTIISFLYPDEVEVDCCGNTIRIETKYLELVDCQDSEASANSSKIDEEDWRQQYQKYVDNGRRIS